MEINPTKEQASQLQELFLLFMQKIVLPFEACMQLPFGVMQFRALCALFSRQAGMKMTELAECLCISKQQVTQIVERMVEMGYLTRDVDPEDRRCVRVNLTETANLLLSEKFSDYAKICDYELEQLSKAQQRRFWTAVENLLAVLPQLSDMSQSAQTVYGTPK